MRILHVVSSLSRSSGGPSRSVQGLVAAECKAGIDAWVWPLKGGKPWIDGVRDVRRRLDDAEELRKTILGFDIVHIHGLWDLRLHKVAVACRRMGIKYIIAPRGMLEPWSLKQKWLKKRIARFLYQDEDLHGAAALHATAESEAEQFRKLGFRNPVIVSPNGVNVPGKSLVASRQLLVGNEKRRCLFVSRMHPKKGVMELVEAWGRLVVSGQWLVRSGWECELVYTVSGELEKEYEEKVKKRIIELGMSYQDTDGTIHPSPSPSSSPSPSPSPSPNFIFTGALNDDEKWKAYGRADLFVLPTYSENFGIVVAEALWAGVPVITTKGAPWQELENRKCGWWIDAGVNPLTAALKESISLSDHERCEMGEQGRKLVAEKYTWNAVVKEMVKGYEGIVSSR